MTNSLNQVSIRDKAFYQYWQTVYGNKRKTWGVIGLGAIGKEVAGIAKAFGCNVIYYSTSGKNNCKDYRRVDFETFLKEADIISVHAPLTDATRGLIDENAFDKMKPTAYFINVGRGPIVKEEALKIALDEDKSQVRE